MKVMWADDSVATSRTILDHFLVMFPVPFLPELVRWTSTSLESDKYSPTSEQEMLKFFGFVYAMSLHNIGPRRMYWETGKDDEAERVHPPMAFGQRFGMSQHRFEILLRHFSFADKSDPSSSDRWWPVRGFIDAINSRRVSKIRPSHVIVADESMCAWTSAKPDSLPDALPHTTKIIRKPKGVGAEIKVLADGRTGVVMRLEIQEGKDAMCHKDWSALPSGTSQLLRLCEPWFQTRRIVVADSAFASTTSAIELKKKGLFFQGIIKTSTHEFPKDYLMGFQYKARGDIAVATATIENVPLLALGWQDKTLKMFIATCGTTDEGVSHKKRRWKAVGTQSEVYYKEVPRPRLAESYFSSAQKVDVHNHLRQGSLSLEASWSTQQWEHRVISTLLGIIEVDAFLIYKESGNTLSHRVFTEKLAWQLIHNQYNKATPVTTRTAARTQCPTTALGDTHTLMALTTLPQYSHKIGQPGGARRKCVVCTKIFGQDNNGHYYCTNCSAPAKGVIVTLCGLRSLRGSRCIDWHRCHGTPS